MTVLPIAYDAQLFINGEFIDAASGKTLDIVNPATGIVIGQSLADASAIDVDRVVAAAQQIVRRWKMEQCAGPRACPCAQPLR